MRLTGSSSDEQPTQELHPNGQSSLTSDGELLIDEMDTELHPIAVEYPERVIQPETSLEQQETLPLVSLLSTEKQPAIECKATEQKTSSPGSSFSDEKKRRVRSHTPLLW